MQKLRMRTFSAASPAGGPLRAEGFPKRRSQFKSVAATPHLSPSEQPLNLSVSFADSSPIRGAIAACHLRPANGVPPPLPQHGESDGVIAVMGDGQGRRLFGLQWDSLGVVAVELVIWGAQ